MHFHKPENAFLVARMKNSLKSYDSARREKKVSLAEMSKK